MAASTNTRSYNVGETNGLYRHGLSRSPEYRVWAAMKDRCSNQNNDRWARYGGRGITVCKRWLKFENFFADMGVKPDGFTLERKDNNKGYSPGNCEWATYEAQARNQKTNRLITHDGETMCLAAWAKREGVKSDVVWKRMKRTGVPIRIR